MAENIELAIIGQETAPPPAGNFNFNSKFSKVRPGTINIVQPTSLNGTKGNLRINETGQEFKTMRVALLMEPVEQRGFYVGDGEMNRKPENLMCFTKNVVRAQDKTQKELQGPDKGSKVPQALKCSNCENSNWDKYRQSKSKDDIPGCDLYVYATLIDTEFKLPLQLYVRSKSKAPFEKGMEQLTRVLLTKMSQDNLPPNYYDVSFTLGTKPIKNERGQTSYILDLSDFKVVSPEEKAAFGEVFNNLIGTPKNDQAALEAQSELDLAQEEIEQAVSAERITI